MPRGLLGAMVNRALTSASSVQAEPLGKFLGPVWYDLAKGPLGNPVSGDLGAFLPLTPARGGQARHLGSHCSSPSSVPISSLGEPHKLHALGPGRSVTHFDCAPAAKPALSTQG